MKTFDITRLHVGVALLIGVVVGVFQYQCESRQAVQAKAEAAQPASPRERGAMIEAVSTVRRSHRRAVGAGLDALRHQLKSTRPGRPTRPSQPSTDQIEAYRRAWMAYFDARAERAETAAEIARKQQHTDDDKADQVNQRIAELRGRLDGLDARVRSTSAALIRQSRALDGPQ